MKINYTLWGTGGCGGTRFIYETANILARRGHIVTITALGPKNYSWLDLDKRIKFICPELCIPLPKRGLTSLNQILNKIFQILKLPFEIDRAKILSKATPDCDVNIATYYPTAKAVLRSKKGKMFYCIQHKETLFSKNPKDIESASETYTFPLKQFVVSHWLKDFLKKEYNQDAVYVGSAANPNIFKPQNNKENRTVCAILRGVSWKGDDDLVEACDIINKKLPNVRFKMIGEKKAAMNMLKRHNVNLDLDFSQFLSGDSKELTNFYSLATVFLFTSHIEGLGVPPLEAMACGTTSVITDCLGIRDFAKNNYNSLVVPIKNPQAVAEAAIKILTDKSLRNKLEKNAIRTAKDWTWERVVDRMESMFQKELSKH